MLSERPAMSGSRPKAVRIALTSDRRAGRSMRFRGSAQSFGRTVNALQAGDGASAHEERSQPGPGDDRTVKACKTASFAGCTAKPCRWRSLLALRHCADSPESLSGIVERTKPSSLNPSRPVVRSAASARVDGRRHPGPFGQHSRFMRPRPRRTFDASCRRTQRLGRSSARRRRDGRKSSHRRRREGDCRLRPQSPNPLSRRARAGQADRQRFTSTSTTSTPTIAASSNGSIALTASPPRTCPTISAGARPRSLG